MRDDFLRRSPVAEVLAHLGGEVGLAMRQLRVPLGDGVADFPGSDPAMTLPPP